MTIWKMITRWCIVERCLYIYWKICCLSYSVWYVKLTTFICIKKNLFCWVFPYSFSFLNVKKYNKMIVWQQQKNYLPFQFLFKHLRVVGLDFLSSIIFWRQWLSSHNRDHIFLFLFYICAQINRIRCLMAYFVGIFGQDKCDENYCS